jgi:valyl-tRNA synthetase
VPLEKLDSKSVEEKWAQTWEEEGAHSFNAGSGKPLYVIDTPPPFPTGEFHMGGVLNWCYIDFVARYKRLRGFEVLFPQGWDCHGFPTEVKVEQKHGRLPREEFVKKCIEWTENVVSTMKPQMKQMGFSIDWGHEYYTVTPEYHEAVQYSLLKMFNEGLVYRGNHVVLWCPHCESAIAKAETDELHRKTVLNYVWFGADKELLVATTRPEMLHACVGVFVHPADERFKDLVGKEVELPLFNRKVKVMSDADVDKEFGTGAVMICTFGDNQDVLWAHRHSLTVIDAFNERGELVNAGDYSGLPAKEAREKVLADLEAHGRLEKREPLQQMVKIHDRCKTPVELMRSSQWFIKTKEFKEDILESAASIKWTPEHMFQKFRDWTENLEWDWCISRQRMFGVPLPFWYCPKCGKVYAPKEGDLPVNPAVDEPPVEKCECGGKPVGETSICDGWIDSSITPLVVAGWPYSFDERLYPSALRPQGTDIIRTWAFYTIFRCKKLTGKVPFKEVLVNGMVCGEDGKKMSKSLNNYVEAKDVVEKAGVDALRQWSALSGGTGKDNQFRWKDVNYAKSFIRKLWNASRFTEKALEGYSGGDADYRVIDKWMQSRLNQTIEKVSKAMDDDDFYSALTEIQSFFWHDYCDYYIEDVKYRVYGGESKAGAQATLSKSLKAVLEMMFPFAPFTTSEIYSELFGGRIKSWPEKGRVDDKVLLLGKTLHEALSQVRQQKADANKALNSELEEVRVVLPLDLVDEFADVSDDLKGVAKAERVVVEAGQSPEVKAFIR